MNSFNLTKNMTFNLKDKKYKKAEKYRLRYLGKPNNSLALPSNLIAPIPNEIFSSPYKVREDVIGALVRRMCHILL